MEMMLDWGKVFSLIGVRYSCIYMYEYYLSFNPNDFIQFNLIGFKVVLFFNLIIFCL